MHAAVGGPGGAFVLIAVAERSGRCPSPRGDITPTVEAATGLGEGDQIAARAPHRRRMTAAAEADAMLVAAVGIHHVDLLAARAIALEHDPTAVGRVAGRGVDPGALVSRTGEPPPAGTRYICVLPPTDIE